MPNIDHIIEILYDLGLHRSGFEHPQFHMEGNTQQLIDYLTLIFCFHIDSGVLIRMGTERELYLERKQMNHNLR